MPRRDDIAGRKPRFAGSKVASSLGYLAAIILMCVGVAWHADACMFSIPTVEVAPDFRVIVRHEETPVAGIRVEIFNRADVMSDDATKLKPILTLLTGQDGAVEVRNLEAGMYLVETKGPGQGDALYAKVSRGQSGAEVSLQWPFSRSGTLKAKKLAGELVSNDPWAPFQNVQVQLWAAGVEKPLAVEDAGPKGRFSFSLTRPGIYVLRVLGRQDGVRPDNQIEGDLPVELAPSAQDAIPSISLRLAMSTCGIKYSSCPASNSMIATASRRIQVNCEPGMCEYPGVANAKFKLLDGDGASIAEGTTDHDGVGELPAEYVGRATLVVFDDSLMDTVQQSFDLLPADPSAPAIVFTMTALVGSENHCSAVSLETNAAQR
jgi:hypothetical protein